MPSSMRSWMPSATHCALRRTASQRSSTDCSANLTCGPKLRKHCQIHPIERIFQRSHVCNGPFKFPSLRCSLGQLEYAKPTARLLVAVAPWQPPVASSQLSGQWRPWITLLGSAFDSRASPPQCVIECRPAGAAGVAGRPSEILELRHWDFAERLGTHWSAPIELRQLGLCRGLPRHS